MSIQPSAHLAVGEGSQVGILTFWTKKEHVMAQVPKQLYAVCAQLYSRDEGISRLVRSLLAHKEIRDLVLVGADLNRCLPTLKALWKNGVVDGEVVGAPGYVDREIPVDAIDRLREQVTLHDITDEVDEYSDVANYIKTIKQKPSWGESETFPEAVIDTPEFFVAPPAHQVIQASLDDALIVVARRLKRFGMLTNVQVVIGSYPYTQPVNKQSFTSLSFCELANVQVISERVNVFIIDSVVSDESTAAAAKKSLSRRSHGDPISNFLIRLENNEIVVTHLAADGKRLEVFSDSSAQNLYKKICSEFRVFDYSHAAYLGYELARAQNALDAGELYEQDQL